MTFRDWTRIRYRVKRGGVLFFIALTLVAIAAIVSANNLLFLIVAAMLATLLISGLVSRLVLAGLELELVLPEHISARRPTPARLRLRNSKRLIPSFSIHLTAEGEKPVIAPSVYFPVLPGNHTADEPVTAVFPRRGEHRENLFSLVTRFPFGFLEKTARVTLRKDTLVYPSLDPQPAIEDLLQGILGEIPQDRRGYGADLYRIRPYVASESARHVDWKSSAHTGALQIREYSAEELGTVAIFLDRSGNPPDAWFEQAIECCAYLVWELSEQSRPVMLLSQDYEMRDDRYAMLKFLAFAAPLQLRDPYPPPMTPPSKFSSPLRRIASLRLAACLSASVICCQTPPPPSTPEPVRSSITVVENVVTETPANISEFSARDLAQTPGVNIDDRLREVPGFSLFRRTSSVVANPTTQGVSLRGIGSSGASRSLVLWDGTPMNDPFGGWVYWTRFPPEDLRRVEISRGASTSVFGDLALGGAIGLFSREAEHAHVYAGYEGGTQGDQDVWTGASNLWRNFALSASARAFRSDGYYVVPGTVRGSVDHPANVEFVTGDFRFDTFQGTHRLFAELNILAEDRENGTVLTHNSTGLGTASLHFVEARTHDEFSFLAFRTQEQYHSTYSAVAADRNSERLTARQTVPVTGNGSDLLWNHHDSGWNFAAGADVNQDRGFSTDAVFPTGRRYGGGAILQHGEFVQADGAWKGFRLFAGLRHQFTGRGNQFLNPSAGLVYGMRNWRLRGSAYRAFRAPTLNELYRDFRAGNTDTQPNNDLRPETLLGAEAGADYFTEHGAIRVTVFRNALSHLITNVTLSSSATQIIRQRQNGPDSLSRGVEFSAMHRWREWRAEVGYLYVASQYATGPRVPQIPKHQGTAQLTWDHQRTEITGGIRAYGLQFEDDLNVFRLPGFATLQLTARERLTKQITVSLALENLLDHQYYTGFTPTPTIGAPRQIRAALHWNK